LFSKLRLEFADFGHDYYTELDGIAITGFIIKQSSLQVERQILSNNVSNLYVDGDEREKNLFDLPV
jgi:hypothetical protein